jgi:hypothetical protein
MNLDKITWVGNTIDLWTPILRALQLHLFTIISYYFIPSILLKLYVYILELIILMFVFP